ncbi:hypothetical protein GCM10011247_14400 [Pseudomonas plecoglossicida]|nr:hypothetical protein GCM10011247_14400 [Pseudomonas plecoglossicida]
MADCDQALHAQRLGACSDALELGDANSAGLVQVDIDLDAMPVGDTEDDVELRLGVAVQGRRVDATDDLDAFANGRFHHFGSTGAGHHTGLGEGHQFDLDQILVRLPGFEDGAQVVQARGGVHVDMAAHGQGAVRRCLADQRLGALDDRRGAGQLALLHGQAFSQGGHRLVRAPTVTDEALVQVDMAVDEPGRASRPSRSTVSRAAVGARCGPMWVMRPCFTAMCSGRPSSSMALMNSRSFMTGLGPFADG